MAVDVPHFRNVLHLVGGVGIKGETAGAQISLVGGAAVAVEAGQVVGIFQHVFFLLGEAVGSPKADLGGDVQLEVRADGTVMGDLHLGGSLPAHLVVSGAGFVVDVVYQGLGVDGAPVLIIAHPAAPGFHNHPAFVTVDGVIFAAVPVAGKIGGGGLCVEDGGLAPLVAPLIGLVSGTFGGDGFPKPGETESFCLLVVAVFGDVPLKGDVAGHGDGAFPVGHVSVVIGNTAGPVGDGDVALKEHRLAGDKNHFPVNTGVLNAAFVAGNFKIGEGGAKGSEGKSGKQESDHENVCDETPLNGALL